MTISWGSTSGDNELGIAHHYAMTSQVSNVTGSRIPRNCVGSGS